MKTIRVDRRVRKAVCMMEWLESRCLLSATVTAQIPAQNVAAGSTSAPISLETYFNDPTVTGTAVVLNTDLGNIPLVLTDSATPVTVSNFKQYITSGEYNGTVFHRSVPGFIVQGGGYTTSGTHIQTNGTIPGESATATLKNTTGTIAMALSTGPDSATSEWFINLANNPPLDEANPMASDYDGGPFTAFGQVVYNGMSVVNAIAALPIVNDSAQSGAWSTIPVQSGTNGATVSTEPASNLVEIKTASIIPGGLTYTAVSSNPSLITASVDPTTDNLTLNPVNGGGMASITITATDMGGGTATSTFAVHVTNSSPIVTIGAGTAKTCTYTDASGAVTSVTLAGGGTTTLDFAGSNILQTTVGKVTSVTGSGLGLSSIATSGTTSGSVLTITAKGGSGPISVGSVTTDALKSFSAKGANVTGNISSSSAIGALALAGASGGIVSAVSLGNVTVSGAFSDSLSLTGSGQSLKTFKAGSIAGGTWDIAGAAQSVTAGSVANWSPDFSQTLKTLTVKGDFTGQLTAGSVGTVVITGAANSSLFHFNGAATDLGKFTVDGAFSSSVINSLGSIGSVTAEALVSGGIYAGIATLSNDLVLPGSIGDFANSASIGSVKLKGAVSGESFSNSDIAAPHLGTLILGTLQTSNGGAPTGIAAESLKSLTATANKKFTLKNQNSSVASILTADGVVLGDVVIDLIQPPTP